MRTAPHPCLQEWFPRRLTGAGCPAHLIKINMLGCGSCILPTMDKAFDIETRKGTQMLSAKWFVSGVSLAVTAGAGYANGLFHGMDFRRLRRR